MRAKKVVINILLTPLALILLLVVVALCVVFTILRYLFEIPYLASRGMSEGCKSFIRSFVEGYEKGKVTVIGEVGHEIKH